MQREPQREADPESVYVDVIDSLADPEAAGDCSFNVDELERETIPPADPIPAKLVDFISA